jgi:hypothetical protein
MWPAWDYGDPDPVTVYEIAPRRCENLVNRLKEAQASPGSRALFCRHLPHHVTQRGNRREPVFFEAEDYRLYRQLVGAPAQQSGPISDAQSHPPANYAHLA